MIEVPPNFQINQIVSLIRSFKFVALESVINNSLNATTSSEKVVKTSLKSNSTLPKKGQCN